MIANFRAAGGGSKSAAWLQICADILGRPFVRPVVSEAGVLGAAIIAGAGSGAFASLAAGVATMVKSIERFIPIQRGSSFITIDLPGITAWGRCSAAIYANSMHESQDRREPMNVLAELKQNVIDGEAETTEALVQTALTEGLPPEQILREGLIAAMSEVGRLFEEGDSSFPKC